MSSDRHRYVAFYYSDWVAGTHRMTRIQKSIYFDLCSFIWDKAMPVPAAELPLMLGDVDGWREIVDVLVEAGKLSRLDDGSIVQDRALEEAEKALALYRSKSAGGRKGGKSSATSRAQDSSSPSGSPSETPSSSPSSSPSRTPSSSASDTPSSTPSSTGQGVLQQNGTERNRDSLRSSPSTIPDAPEPSVTVARFARSTEPPSGYTQEFEDFWSSYPRKEGKAPAFKAWKRLSARDRSAAAADVPKRTTCHSQWLKDNGQFIPHAATYLNQRRWEDEIQPIAPGGGHEARQRSASGSGLRPVDRVIATQLAKLAGRNHG